ncbi:MAG: HAMP domain-containing sensor histidine kinase [Acidobacteriota bacterium]
MLHRDTSRAHAPFLVGLLVTTAALVVGLAVQAWALDGYHREATEGVLRDYATLAGDEALRRVIAEIGYYGYLPAIGALRESVRLTGGVASLDDLRGQADAASRRGLELVESAFVFDVSSNSLTPIVGESVARQIREHLGAAETRADADFAAFAVEGPEGLRHFVATGVEPTRPDMQIGFWVDLQEVARRGAATIESRPLLPRSLGNGQLDNSVLYLRIEDRAASVLFSRGERYEQGLIVERHPPDDYDPVIEGLHVRVAVDPNAAHRLVIGGLPRARLPALMAVFGLTLGLLLMATLLLRRERTLVAMRTDFVSRVSHELRTPLAQIRMFAETLRLGRVRSEEERAQYLEILERESRRLSALVENVLQFSRAERGELQLELESTSVRDLCERLASEMRPLLSARGCSLQVDVPEDLEVHLAPDAVHQALLNLVDNAVKYGPEGQQIRLSAVCSGGALRLAVEDQGPGIPKAQRDRVWAPFDRGAGPSKSGTGIGLAVVRDVVSAHGGSCWVEGCKPHGARVVVELPLDATDSSS